MLTQQQIDNRRNGLGGSDIPIILGLSSYKTPYQLYLEKLGLVTPSQGHTEAQYFGSMIEGILRNRFATDNNVKIHAHVEDALISPPCDLITYDLDTTSHPVFDFLLANVDGYIPEWNEILEAKVSLAYAREQLWGATDSDVIPMEYLVQVAHYSNVYNSTGARLAALRTNYNYCTYKYNRDAVLERKMVDVAQEFWNAVKNEVPPPLVDLDDLQLMYPKHEEGRTIVVDDRIEPVVFSIRDTKAKIKELNDIEKEAKFQIMEYMQDAECLVDENGTPLVTWKATKRGSRTFLVKEDKSKTSEVA